MNTLQNILLMRCPRCHQATIFESKIALNPLKMTIMKTHCSQCELRYEREPGYFFGSMYISYAINVGLFIAFLVAYLLFFQEKISGLAFFAVYLFVSILAFPLIFRLSRSIWLHAFVPHEPNKKGEY